jgi:hypothetical protein
MNKSLEQWWKVSGKLKTEILEEKHVPVPLSLKLCKGTEDNHKNFIQYKCMPPPPHNVGNRLLQGGIWDKNMPDPYSLSQ